MPLQSPLSKAKTKKKKNRFDDPVHKHITAKRLREDYLPSRDSVRKKAMIEPCAAGDATPAMPHRK